MARIGDTLARKSEQLPQFDYLFRVDLPDIPSTGFSIEYPITDGSVQGFSGAEDISHRVYSVNAPLTEFETKKNTKRDTFFYTTTSSDIGSISLRLDEYEDGKSLQYLLAWQDLFGNEMGRNPPAAYKGNVRVIRMSSLMSDVHVHYYTGYFPNSISPMAFSYDTNGVLQYEVTFTGDSVTHMIIPAGQVKAAIEQNHQMVVGNLSDVDLKLSDLTDSAKSKIESTFKPQLDQVIGVVNKMDNFKSQARDKVSSFF